MSLDKIAYSTSLFIGVTSRGVEMPVFFDIHTPLFNDNPPTTLITGQPGSGKTFLTMTLTADSATLDKTTIVLDPKGDFLGFWELKNKVGKVEIINLNDDSKKGILDPFYMSDRRDEKLDLVINTLDMFLGGLDNSQLSIISPIVKDTMNSKVPSLLEVLRKLTLSANPEARHLGSRLDMVSNLPMSNLCFAPGNKSQRILKVTEGTTIVTMPGLELNADSSKEDANNKQRLASGIFYLLTDFIVRMMNEDNSTNPKTLIIDEAWAVLNTKAGAATIKSVGRLGRSRNLAMILVTQNNYDIKEAKIENTVSTRFAFRTDSQEAKDIVSGMQLPEGEGFEQILLNLGKGECLMKDYRGRYSVVQITNHNQEWNKAFESNPLKRLANRKNKKS